VVRNGATFKIWVSNYQMKPNNAKTISGARWTRFFRSRALRHDPMLVLNMSIFNFTDGWGRTFAKYDYARFRA